MTAMSQLLNCLRRGGFALGYLHYFNVPAFRLGIRREVNQL
jgi:hypothetical protein